MISPTFFILKINKILSHLSNDNRFQILLYMDDLEITYSYPNWRIVERKIQDIMNIFEKFAQKNGFKSSTSKTSVLQFNKLSIPPSMELRIDNIRIQKSETVKYLGLVFDSKLDWKAHVKQFKSKLNKTLNLMRSVTSTEWGADQKTLVMIYSLFIRSKIDYGCIVYNFVSSRKLESLELISNEAVRISNGCFKYTPTSSLQVITEESPLQIRRHELSLKYYYKVKFNYKIRLSKS